MPYTRSDSFTIPISSAEHTVVAQQVATAEKRRHSCRDFPMTVIKTNHSQPHLWPYNIFFMTSHEARNMALSKLKTCTGPLTMTQTLDIKTEMTKVCVN